MEPFEAYSADRSLKAKVRRRWARVVHRRPLRSMIDRPIVSITFDDAPKTAVEAGARVLEEAGVKGTFYACAGLDNREGPMGVYGETAGYVALAARGHEIACHTYSHLDCGQAAGPVITADVDRNAAALTAVGLDTRNFAYPYGDVSPQAKAVLQGRFGSLRGLHPGLIREGSDLNLLPAVGIEGPNGEANAARWIDKALASRAWLILYTHDVRPDPSPWGCTPGALKRLIQRAKAGGAEIATVAEVLDRLEAAA